MPLHPLPFERPTDAGFSGAGLALVYTRQTHPGVIIIPLLVISIGVGCVFQPTLIALQAHSAKSRRAVIISNRNFNRCASGACGLAISAAVLQARLRATLPPEYAYLAESTYALPVVPGGVPPAVLDAYMAASRAVFVMQLPLIGLCFLGAMFVKERGLAPKDEGTEEQSLEQRDEEGGEEAGPQGVDHAPDTRLERGENKAARSDAATV